MPPAPPSRARDLLELVFGYGVIVGVIWMPETLQRIFFPIAVILTLIVVLIRLRPNGRSSANILGLGLRGSIAAWRILPAAAALAGVSVFAAEKSGTLHALYKGDLKHIAGYVAWTIYQQFLLQDYFMDRLLRLISSRQVCVIIAGTLFAVAHLPNPWLSAATLVWGIASCALFRRYRSIWILGLTQGLLGLCFAVCVPDALHHHLRVGLGYLRYTLVQPIP